MFLSRECVPSSFGKMSEERAPEIVVRVYIPDLKANVSVPTDFRYLFSKYTIHFHCTKTPL